MTKPDLAKLTHAYKAMNETGWAAGDEKGRTWPISAEEAAELPKVTPYETLAKSYPGLDTDRPKRPR